jgi:hypothetical protein
MEAGQGTTAIAAWQNATFRPVGSRPLGTARLSRIHIDS